jgi:catechol 2,3-dioxygenase-like lactoylglutathione lyase family enzyme
MKRFHVNLSVQNLDKSLDFYRTLFGVEPTVVKPDYAKWMLDDPAINFAICESTAAQGINHVGLQVDSLQELGVIQSRLREAQEKTLDQDDAQCCYAHSTKTWVQDPDRVAWETFVTHGQTTQYGDDIAPLEVEDSQADTGDCCRVGA